MQSPLSMAVIGVGHFGRYHAEKIANLSHANLVAVVDADKKNARKVAKQHGAQPLTDYRELFGQVDAVTVAAPTSEHHRIVRDCLENGIDVLVEKPITPDVDSAADLIEVAARHERILQVGHLERFSGVVEAVRKHVTRPLFIDSVRIAPFKPRSTDVNVILDLMIHDLDLILCLVNAPIKSVDAAGAPVFMESEDIASARIVFENGCIANIVASRISLKSERKMRIFAQDRYLSVDMENRQLNGVSTSGKKNMLGIPDVNIENENYSDGDSLEKEISAFIAAVRDRTRPVVSGEEGRAALEAAVKVNESLRAHAEFLKRADPDFKS